MPRRYLKFNEGFAPGSGFAPMFMGQRPYDGHSPILFHSIAARRSLASHPAAKPRQKRRSRKKGTIRANLSNKSFVQVTPAPAFTGFEASDDRMLSLVKMLSGVPVRRRVAATDVTTRETETQVLPR